MKELILISAFCPDDKRENILRDLLKSIQKYKSNFDIMIVSHTPLPIDLQKMVEFYLYDKKNEILTDWDLLNQPWFSPNNDRLILSSFLSKKNTHLAIWRMFTLGFSLAKNIGYKKIHCIEYDCIINDIEEFHDNSSLLEEYDSIVYLTSRPPTDKLLLGSFFSLKVDKIPTILLNLDEERIKQMIRSSLTKSPERMLQKLLEEHGKVFFKDRDEMETKGNRFGLFDGQVDTNFIPWALPYYDELTENVDFIVWNTKKEKGVKLIIILNEEKIFKIDIPHLNYWKMINLGKLEEINSILIIEDDKIKDLHSLKTQEEKDIFRKLSYRKKEL